MMGYYRNRRDVTSIEGIEVDAGSLWKLNTELNILVLEDEDEYVTANVSTDFETQDYGKTRNK